MSRKRYSLDDIRIDSERGVISYLGEEWVLFRVKELQRMIDETYRAFSSGASTIWYVAGRGAGKSFVKLVRSQKENLTTPELIGEILNSVPVLGWGRAEVASIDQEKGESVIRVHNNPLVRNRKSNQPVCFYLKGCIEGALQELFSKEFKCEEIMCMAKGDPYCEFQVKLKKK